MATAGRLGLKDPAVVDLVMWKDPKVSGGVLGGAAALYVLLELSSFTLIEMAATTGLVLTLFCTFWSIVAGYMGKDGVPIPAFMQEGISEEVARKVVLEKGLPLLNKALAMACKLAKGEDKALAGKIIVGLFLAAKIGHYFTVLTFLFLGVALFMSVPKLYDTYHEEIDKVIDQAMTKLKELEGVVKEKVAAVVEKLPIGKPAASKQD